jgi:hypothetical protein
MENIHTFSWKFQQNCAYTKHFYPDHTLYLITTKCERFNFILTCNMAEILLKRRRAKPIIYLKWYLRICENKICKSLAFNISLKIIYLDRIVLKKCFYGQDHPKNCLTRHIWSQVLRNRFDIMPAGKQSYFIRLFKMFSQ